MSLYHISYDAKDYKDSEALRIDIPKALLSGGVGVATVNEPVRSTFRFIADGGDDNRKRIFSIVAGFSNRCYYFITCADEYVKDGETYFKGKTVANAELEENFQTVLKEALSEE